MNLTSSDIAELGLKIRELLYEELVTAPMRRIGHVVYRRTRTPKARIVLQPRVAEVLSVIDREPHGLTQKQLQRKLGLGRNAIAGAVYQLTHKGLVKSVVEPQ